MTDFPDGNVARQERFIVAFNGLTQLMASENARTQSSKHLDWMNDTWNTMFNTLLEEPARTRAREGDEE